jgi:LPXTG-site transpeptidase (sortase) family protein
MHDSFSHRKFNNLLSLAVLALAVYILLMPILPIFEWWASHSAPVISRSSTLHVDHSYVKRADSLIIPRLGLSDLIHEGSSVHTLHFGVWHLPESGNPALGSNTVLAGHRYTYSGSGVFYHLDLVRQGDPITLIWNHQQYDYTVTKIEVVPPSEISVQAPTQEARLTIYTCTPLWTFTDRLVVIAKPDTLK